MKAFIFSFMLLLSSVCFSQEPVFRQIKAWEVHHFEKDLLEIMPPYDSLFTETTYVWGSTSRAFIHFYNGLASIGYYFDAFGFLDLAIEKNFCKLDTNIKQYYGIFKDTIFMEPMPKDLSDSIVPLLNSIIHLKTDPVFDSCTTHAGIPDDVPSIAMHKIVYVDSTISKGEFRGLSYICNYCPANMKYKQIATMQALFNKAYEPVASIVYKKRVKLILKRFAELRILPKE